MRLAVRASLAAALALAAAPAAAGDWTLDGTAFERIEADSNLRLVEDGEPLIGSVSGVALELGLDARRTRASLGTGLNARGYAGPGDAGGLEGLSDPRIEGEITHRDRRQVLEADFDLLRRPTAFTQAEETGLTEGDATETRLLAGAGWRRMLGPRDTLSLRAETELRRFSGDESALAPSTAWTARGHWGRQLDARTEAGLGLRHTRFQADGADGDRRTGLVTLSADLARRPTRRHRIALTAGVGRSATESAGVEDADLHLAAGLDFDWQGPGGATASLTAAQTLEPTGAGALQDTTRLAARLGRPLTREAQLALDAAWLRRAGEDVRGANSVLRLGPRLDMALARDWSAGLGLTLRLADGDEGTARSAGLFLEVRRAFELAR